MLDTTIRKQTQKHNTTYVGHHYTSADTKTQHNICWTPLRKQTQKHNTTYVGHHYA